MLRRRRASGTMRGSAVKTPSTSVWISQASALSAAASATAVMSEPPRPRVVSSSSDETPWKPATMAITPRSRVSCKRCARTSTMRALPWRVSVTTPACAPVSETASRPSSFTAMARRAMEMRSPAESSMSSSRGCGSRATLAASPSSSSVVCPMAETTTQTRFPTSAVATTRRATARMRSASATDVPPYFWTMRATPER